MVKRKIAIMISGRGVNMLSLIKESQYNYFPGIVDCVISNNIAAGGLTIAEGMGIATFVVQKADLGSLELCDSHISRILNSRGVEYICLAGFMRIIGKNLLEAWPNRIFNMHPSLLPSFRGLDAQRQAIDCGVKIAGCTVHLVDEGLDTGPIISQAAVAVSPNDTRDSLADKILEIETICYPYAIMKTLGSTHEALQAKVDMAASHGAILS